MFSLVIQTDQQGSKERAMPEKEPWARGHLGSAPNQLSDLERITLPL